MQLLNLIVNEVMNNSKICKDTKIFKWPLNAGDGTNLGKKRVKIFYIKLNKRWNLKVSKQKNSGNCLTRI